MLLNKNFMILLRQLPSSIIYPGKQWQTQYLYIWKHCALVMEQTIALSHVMYLPVKWIVFLHYSYCIYNYSFDIFWTVTSSGKTSILSLPKHTYLLHINKFVTYLHSTMYNQYIMFSYIAMILDRNMGRNFLSHHLSLV